MTRHRRQTERLELRLEPADLRAIREAAAAAGCSVSVWLRTIAVHAARLDADLRRNRDRNL